MTLRIIIRKPPEARADFLIAPTYIHAWRSFHRNRSHINAAAISHDAMPRFPRTSLTPPPYRESRGRNG